MLLKDNYLRQGEESYEIIVQSGQASGLSTVNYAINVQRQIQHGEQTNSFRLEPVHVRYSFVTQ